MHKTDKKSSKYRLIPNTGTDCNSRLTLILQNIMGEFYYTNQLFFTFINIFIILYIHEKEVFHKRTIILILFGINALLIIWSILQGSYTVNLDILHNYVIVLLAIFLRYLVSGYNYEEIQTSEVKKGMVLSYATVVGFMPSRVKGLPQTTSEDMSSRITEEEAEAVRRWEKSKYGKNSIIIVRKIPFAIFSAPSPFLSVFVVSFINGVISTLYFPISFSLSNMFSSFENFPHDVNKRAIKIRFKIFIMIL